VDISVTFTSRGLIPTSTARESEDSKWKLKIQQMLEINRRKKELKDATLDEQHPEYLKEKGNQFFKNGNYESALNAYTAALELDPSNVGFVFFQLMFRYLSNRSACHLKLNSPSDAFKDTMMALDYLAREEELLKQQLIEEDAQDRSMRIRTKIKVYLRKGAAQLAMGNKKGAIEDYQAASNLDPSNEEIKKNLKEILSE
jgi:tetratricopeptide (TPR) repeat protein